MDMKTYMFFFFCFFISMLVDRRKKNEIVRLENEIIISENCLWNHPWTTNTRKMLKSPPIYHSLDYSSLGISKNFSNFLVIFRLFFTQLASLLYLECNNIFGKDILIIFLLNFLKTFLSDHHYMLYTQFNLGSWWRCNCVKCLSTPQKLHKNMKKAAFPFCFSSLWGHFCLLC